MDEQPTQPTSTIVDQVFAAASQALAEREREETDVQAWATGSQIAHLTDLPKDEVLAALQALDREGRLHVKSAAAGDDIEVTGVDHGPQADSLEEPVAE